MNSAGSISSAISRTTPSTPRPGRRWLCATSSSKRGFEVKLPVAGKTAAKSRQKDNRRKLEECGAVVLYWGLAPQTWVEEQLSGLKKALGWRRARPFSALRRRAQAKHRNPFPSSR